MEDFYMIRDFGMRNDNNVIIYEHLIDELGVVDIDNNTPIIEVGCIKIDIGNGRHATHIGFTQEGLDKDHLYVLAYMLDKNIEAYEFLDAM